MRAYATLVLFVAGMLLAAGAAVVLNEARDRHGTDRDSEQPFSEMLFGPRITGVEVWGVSGRTAHYLSIEVTGGSEPVRIDDTLVTITGENGTHSLRVD